MSSQDMKFSGEIFRKDHPMILACNRHLATILPVRLQYDSGGYKAGVVLARQTSGAASGTYTKYSDSAGSGIGTAAAILFQDVDVSDFADASDTVLARGIFGGEVFEDKVTGLDANGKTDLGSRSIVDASGAQILKF